MGILENILVNKPKWSRTSDQLKNIIWKKMPVGKRKSLIGKKKRQKFSFEKRRSLGEAAKRTPYQIALLNYKSGSYGTPDAPRRGALHRAAFWDAYHGKPSIKHVRGSIAAAHAKAGRDMAKLDKKKAQIKEAIKFIRTKGDEDSEHKIVGHNGEPLGTISRGWLRRGGSQWVVNRSDKPAKGYASLKLAKKALMSESKYDKEILAKQQELDAWQLQSRTVKSKRPNELWRLRKELQNLVDKRRSMIKEDLIGKKTASVEDIAKKHGLSVDQIKAQIAKGVGVEREHTNSDTEAEEIARDHLDEFPDYYDRLDKMETKAKKDMKESSNLKGPFADPKVRAKWQHTHGVPSEAVKKRSAAMKLTPFKIKAKRDMKEDFSAGDNVIVTKNVGGDKGPFRHNPWFSKGDKLTVKKHHKDGHVSVTTRNGERIGIKIPATHIVKEDAPAMSVASGAIAGMPTADSAEKTPVRRPLNPLRRKKFAGKTVFVVDPTTYHKAHLGKRKYEHYEKYLEGCDIADYIREYGRKYWAEPIILENEQTGAMIYLKYGSK